LFGVGSRDETLPVRSRAVRGTALGQRAALGRAPRAPRHRPSARPSIPFTRSKQHGSLWEPFCLERGPGMRPFRLAQGPSGGRPLDSAQRWAEFRERRGIALRRGRAFPSPAPNKMAPSGSLFCLAWGPGMRPSRFAQGPSAGRPLDSAQRWAELRERRGIALRRGRACLRRLCPSAALRIAPVGRLRPPI